MGASVTSIIYTTVTSNISTTVPAITIIITSIIISSPTYTLFNCSSSTYNTSSFNNSIDNFFTYFLSWIKKVKLTSLCG